MKIIGYKVTWRVGAVGNLEDKDKIFLGENPIEKRREALKYAASIGSVMFEGIKDGHLPFKTSVPVSEFESHNIFPVVSACLLDGNQESNELEISGLFLEILIDNWAEELEYYEENEYDTGGEIHFMDASSLNRGYVRVLKDDYDAYASELIH